MPKQTYQEILAQASDFIKSFKGHVLNVIDVAKPTDMDYAISLSRVISKLSPMLGNIIEYRLVAAMNPDYSPTYWA